MRDDVFRPRVACGVICEEDGKILMVRENQPDEGIVWNQPVGHLDAGEDVLAAARREAYEETGLEVALDALLGVYVWPQAGGDTTIRICFIAHVTGGQLGALDKAVVEEAVWLTPAELAAIRPRLRNPIAARCIDDYLAGRRYPLESVVVLAGLGSG